MSSTSSMHWRGPGHVATLPSPLCDGRHVSQCRRPPSDSAPPCSSEASTHHVGSGCPWQGLHYIYVDFVYVLVLFPTLTDKISQVCLAVCLDMHGSHVAHRTRSPIIGLLRLMRYKLTKPGTSPQLQDT